MSSNAGYESIRVAIFLIWSERRTHPAVLQTARAWRATVRPGAPVPVVMERVSGLTLETSPDAGYRAVAALIECAGSVQSDPEIPPFSTEQPYYPACLQLFAMIAATETLQGCMPL